MNEEARCPRHPESPAVGLCTRCGVFFCDQDRRILGGKDYCERCAALPEVDYLEAFRLKYWGKRDAWAWVLGAGGLLSGLAGLSVLVEGLANARLVGSVLGLLNVGGGIVGAAFWLGHRWARVAILALPLALAATNAVLAGLGAAMLGLLPFFMALAIFFDTRNQLFFRIPVPRARLHKAWDLYANNTLARMGFQTALAGLLIVPLAPAALGLSIVALTRVDSKAHPPIGKKGQAIAGIVLGAVGTVLLAIVAAAVLRDLNAGSP